MTDREGERLRALLLFLFAFLLRFLFCRWRKFVHLYAFLVAYYLSIVIFFIIARFRLPLMPALIVFAAFALCTVYDGLLQRKKAVIGYAIAAILMALTMRPYKATYIYPNDYGMLGYILANRGEYGRAIGYLERAAEGFPSHPGSTTTSASFSPSKGATRRRSSASSGSWPSTPGTPRPIATWGSST